MTRYFCITQIYVSNGPATDLSGQSPGCGAAADGRFETLLEMASSRKAPRSPLCQMYVCVMDRQGKKLVHTNVKDNDFNFVLKLIELYKHDLTVCRECMFGWYWPADLSRCSLGGGGCLPGRRAHLRAGPCTLRQSHSRRQKQKRPRRTSNETVCT